MLPFSSRNAEAAYQSERQLFLSRQDVYAGVVVALLGFAWTAKGSQAQPLPGAAFLLSAPALLLLETACAAAFLLPAFVSWQFGVTRYLRWRRQVVLLLRIICLLCPLLLDHLVPPLPLSSAASGASQPLARLFLAAHGFPLLAAPLGFQLDPRCSLALQTAGLAGAMWRIQLACGCCYLQTPGVRAQLASAAHWLGHSPTLASLPLPPMDMPASVDPCLAIALWLQICWLYLLPALLAAKWDLQARREFALAQPAGDMPAADRSWWAALRIPSCTHLLLLLMPTLALSVWQIMVNLMALAAGKAAAAD